MARPPVCTKRLSVNEEWQVLYKFKRPWSDGRTHVVLSPLEFLEKLSALVPLPYLHLSRYSGVLAPNSLYRSRVIPGKTRSQIKQEQKESEVPTLKRGTWAKILARVFQVDVTKCKDCGGEIKIISSICDAFVISKILTHLGMSPRPPPIAPARIITLEF